MQSVNGLILALTLMKESAASQLKKHLVTISGFVCLSHREEDQMI